MKICVLGCGLRTPLLLHGLIHAQLAIDEVALYDVNPANAFLMAQLGGRIAAATKTRVAGVPAIEQAIENSSFVISSIRVGDMERRAADERLALECGFAGQETTGPAGFAMALRTIPVALGHARLVERLAPSAWIVNFTNPAGIITQAVSLHTDAKVIGICDTPAELFFQIARALGEDQENVKCEYFGLNHLGWVRSITVGGQDAMRRLLDNDRLIRFLYPTELFSGAFIRALGLIPTEYLFFYYNQTLAKQNQMRIGITRGEELSTLNRQVRADLENYVCSGDVDAALAAYRRYLNRRNASYMKLEGVGQSAFEGPEPDWDPFEGATGYHRIAVDSIRALTSAQPRSMVLNVRNQGAIEGIATDEIVEVPCLVDQFGSQPLAVGAVPESVRGLIIAVKYYERLAIRAAVEERWDLATLALTVNPIVGNWEAAHNFLMRLADVDPEHFSRFSG